MKRNEPMHISEIVSEAFRLAGAEAAFERQRACSLWAEVVGAPINRQTVRRWVEDTTLHVTIASPILRNDLSFMQDRLIESLNRAAGKQLITRIVFH